MRFCLLISAGLGVPALLAGCSSNTSVAIFDSTPKFSHATHGVVSRDDPRLSAAIAECGKQSYAQGITIDGRLVTDRNEASAAWSRYVLDHVSGAGSGAGSSAGTVDTRSGSLDPPGLATQDASSTSSRFKKPHFYARFRELEQQTWACVERRGWKRLTSPW